MNTATNKKTVILAIPAILLMAGGGALLYWTINSLYIASSMLAVVSTALLSVFMYILGASLPGWSIKQENMYHCGGRNNGIMFALLLIAAGSLLLCFNTEILNPVWKTFFFSWPMLLFVIGATNICKSHFISGMLFAATGIFFLIGKTSEIFPEGIHSEQLTTTYWPVLIVVCGILILLGVIIRPGRFKNGRFNKGYHHKGNWKEGYTPDENENSDGKINYQFVFSGTEQVILDPIFKGGRIDVTFGGMELDLRRTSLAEGDTFLSINTTFGGVEITAPDSWDIEIQAKSTIGGVTDSRDKNVEKDRTRKLIIIATCTLGGIEIK